MEFLLFDGLMRATNNGDITYGLAKAYEISPNQLTYTFYLRDAKWSDGTPITAHDFERTWKEILSPDFPSQSPFLLYAIKGAKQAKKGEIPLSSVGITALNDKTLKVELNHPTPYFLELTSFCALFPTPLSMGNDLDEIASNNPSSLVSCGPFVLKDYKTASHYTLVKNPLYWDHSSISIETIDISLIQDDSTAYNLFKTGKIDILGLAFSQIPRDAIPYLKKSEQLSIVPIIATSMVQFNTTKPPFNNANLRKAIAYSIDRKSLCDHVTQMNEKVADGIVSNYNDGIEKEGIDLYYDIEKARTYFALALEELGCSKEEIGPIKYLYTPSDQNTRLVAAISSQINHALGLKISLECQEFQLFLGKLRKKDFEICQTAWISQFNDPINILDRFRTSNEPTNDTGWENIEYRKNLERAEQSTDFDKRLQYLRAAESIFMEELPQTPIFFWNFSYIKQSNIENIETTPIGLALISRVRKNPPLKTEISK